MFGGQRNERNQKKRDFEASVCAAGGAAFGERFDGSGGQYVWRKFASATSAPNGTRASESIGGESGRGGSAVPADFVPVWKSVQRGGKNFIARNESGDTVEPRQSPCV